METGNNKTDSKMCLEVELTGHNSLDVEEKKGEGSGWLMSSGLSSWVDGLCSFIETEEVRRRINI